MIHLRRVYANDFKQLQQVSLTLPPRGRCLVQGRNEAGKSTLFEAVFFGLFGQALASETSAGKLDDLIRYDAAEALVELDVSLADGRVLSIARRLRRDRQNVWQLDIHLPDGSVEEIRGNRAVNGRIEEELGFDGAALLNTCFVEQKKLEKLEGMTLQQREESLMKLLNLDRLTEIHDQLRLRPADRERLQRARNRAALAALQAERPDAEARLAKANRILDRLTVLAAIDAAVVELDMLAALDAEVAAATAEAEALAERAAAAAALAEGRVRWQQGRTAFDQAAEAEAALDAVAARRTHALRARDVELPAVRERGIALGWLGRRLDRVARHAAAAGEADAGVAACDADLARLAEAREELNRVRRDWVEARGAAREARDAIAALEQDRRAFDVRAALADWVALLETQSALADPAAAIAAATVARSAARRRVVVELAALAVAAVAALGIGAATGATMPGAVAAIVAAALLVWRAVAGWRRDQALSIKLGRIEGEAALAAREAERWAAREAESAERFKQLNAVRPAGGERSRRALEEVDVRLGSRSRVEVETALEAARDRLARATVATESLEAREKGLRESAGRVDGAALGAARDRLARRGACLARLVDGRRRQVEARAADLGVPPEALAVEREIGVLRAEHKALSERVQSLAGLDAEHARMAAGLERHRAAARAAWEALPPVGDGAPAWSPDIGAAEWDAVGDALRDAYAAAGGDAIRRATEDAARRAAELSGRRMAAGRTLDGAVAAIVKRLDALGVRVAGGAQVTATDRDDNPRVPATARTSSGEVAASGAVEPGPVGAFLAAAGDAVRPERPVDSAALTAERDRVRARVDVIHHDIARLSRELGLQGEVLDPAHEEAEAAGLAHALAVRERAAAIVDHAGRNVVRRVLPSTMTHMRRLLPLLTQDRYFDAQLSDDYRIEVYDERARTWKKKNIFSGGTRDQLSLALRLAFALATLPEERGAAPSFLFLDEPLGAFDEERARALVDLLTRGEVAESFDQIFLISHVRVDPGLFDYHVTLAHGIVAESDLPAGDAAGDGVGGRST